MTDKKKAAGANQTANENKQSNNNLNAEKKARFYAKARLPLGDEYIFKGQLAKTISALVHAGNKGVTALEVSCWAFRLASYVYDLRHDYGLSINMIEEPHEHGWHARYVLLSPVVILEEG